MKLDRQPNEAIDVEKLMAQVRERVREKRQKGIYPQELENKLYHANASDQVLHQDLVALNSMWNLPQNHTVRSTRPVVGRLIEFIRRVVRWSLRSYVDTAMAQQSQWNASAVRIMNQMAAQAEDQSAKRAMAMLAERVKELEDTMGRLAAAPIPTAVSSAPAVLAEGAQPKGFEYYPFEDLHRGPEEHIKAHQSFYLQYFAGCRNVLDIGCGRGEFLELMLENNIAARGIDFNEDMVKHCRRKGLDVALGTTNFLQEIPDKELDGIFMSHVIEHLQGDLLWETLKLCYDKLQYGGHLVLETPNPRCLMIFASAFYVDPTHVKPVHPETVTFALKQLGFREVQWIPRSQVPDVQRLQYLPEDGNSWAPVMNENLRRVNELVYGHQDYGVVARK